MADRPEIPQPAASKRGTKPAQQTSGLLPGWKYRTLSLILAAAFGVIVGFAAARVAIEDPRAVSVASNADSNSMDTCETRTLKLLNLTEPLSTALIKEVTAHCYSQLLSQGIIDDSAIRKVNFLQQHRANSVLLWMVVAITVSGVILAGLQLGASYKLAAANQATSLDTSGELSLQKDQVVLKSSVTGLFILLISFGFFLVFVFYVYRIENPDGDASVRGQQIQSLPRGQLGAPAKPEQ